MSHSSVPSVRMSLPRSSARLILLRLDSTGRLARNRLLPILLAAAQQLQVSSPARQCLLRDSLKASGVLLVDGLSPNERRLLRLDNLVAGLNALRSTEKNKKVSVGVLALALRSVVEEFTYGFAGVLGPVLDFLSCA